MKHFKIEPYWWDEHTKIYENDSIDIKDGVTILLGCNGSGKTTFIHQIKQCLKKDTIRDFSLLDDEEDEDRTVFVTEYDELTGGRSHATEKFGFYGDFDRMCRNLSSSEGENVSNNFGDYLGSVRPLIEKARNKNAKEFWMFLDGVDSGVSIDMIRQQSSLFALIESDIRNSGMVPYIIVSSNQYESIGKYKDRCLDVINLKYVSINSYDEFVNYILYTSELKDIRYEKANEIKRKRRDDKETETD